jgi:hypothetical protein
VRERTEGEGEDDIPDAGGLGGYLLPQVFVCYEIEKPGAYGFFINLACQGLFRGQATHVSGVYRIDQAGRLPNQPIRSLAECADGLRRSELNCYLGHLGSDDRRVMRTVR